MLGSQHFERDFDEQVLLSSRAPNSDRARGKQEKGQSTWHYRELSRPNHRPPCSVYWFLVMTCGVLSFGYASPDNQQFVLAMVLLCRRQ